tara:strand:+ start:433 stop:1113 length:681 start_codon:yes stop_codon:yes gene_type:complete
MAYYLGRDVKIWYTTEDTTTSIQQNGTSSLLSLNTGSGASVKVEDGTAHATFALRLHADSVQDGDALTDITGIDISLGSVDEDVSYMGQRSVLKAEIKKETTITVTRKKKGMLWDLAFNGPSEGSGSVGSGGHAVRHGLSGSKMSDGLLAPKDHLQSSDVSFGYRIHVQLQGSTEVISVPGCQITGHTVTLNADGTTEETMEFASHCDPMIATTPNVTTRLSTSTI